MLLYSHSNTSQFPHHFFSDSGVSFLLLSSILVLLLQPGCVSAQHLMYASCLPQVCPLCCRCRRCCCCCCTLPVAVLPLSLLCVLTVTSLFLPELECDPPSSLALAPPSLPPYLPPYPFPISLPPSLCFSSLIVFGCDGEDGRSLCSSVSLVAPSKSVCVCV